MPRTTKTPLLTADVKGYYSADAGTTWYQFYALGVEVSDKKDTEDITPAGHRTAVGVSYGKESSEITLTGPATYGELEEFCGTVANSPSTPKKYQIYYGTADNTKGGYLYADCVVTGWTIEQDENSINLTVNLVGKKGVYKSGTGNVPTPANTPDKNTVVLRGRNSFTAAGAPDASVGTSITIGGGAGTTGAVEDWYSWSVECSNLAQNVYYGYSIVPDFQGCGVVDASFSLNWDADPDNVADSNRYAAETWTITNVTKVGSDAYTVVLDFKSMCVENSGFTDEQEIVRSYQSSHKIIEGPSNIITVTCTPPTSGGNG